MLQYVAEYLVTPGICGNSMQCVAVCCNLMRCVEVCCSMLQCVAEYLATPELCCSVLLWAAMRCSVLQCVAVYSRRSSITGCCGVLQRVAACCNVVLSVCVCECCGLALLQQRPHPHPPIHIPAAFWPVARDTLQYMSSVIVSLTVSDSSACSTSR